MSERMSSFGQTSDNDNPDVDQSDSKADLVDAKSLVSQRMTIAGVFFDIALFVADVEHLKFTIDWGNEVINNYGVVLGLLITSLILQVIVGGLLFLLSVRKTKNLKPSEEEMTQALHHIIIGLVSIIALVNICATIFGDRSDNITRFSQKHNCTIN